MDHSQVERLARKASNGSPAPIFGEIPFKPPVSYYAALRGDGGKSLLFESARGPVSIARYSFIGIEPYADLRVKDGLCMLTHGGLEYHSEGPPLRMLRRITGAYRQERVAGLPPFQGGAAGLICYDFIKYIERIELSGRDELGLPDLHLMMFDRVLAFDHAQRRSWIIVSPGAREMVGGSEGRAWPDAKEWASLYEEASRTMQDLSARLEDTSEAPPAPTIRHGAGVRVISETPAERYIEMARQTKRYIATGDIFQANISLRISSSLDGIQPWDLYLALREINPSPFGGYIEGGDYQIVSSSPERLISLREGVLETRPIAGTRPRGADRDEDKAMRAELLLNEKERAEHIMLIDLERNDIGRVCSYGTVEVDELMTIEDYSHVIHIVSNVKGRLAPGKSHIDALKATFPGGTITGVPKVRCMQIIDELEGLSRGPYTGSMGYFSYTGEMDLNIVIRTFVVKDGVAHVQAGAGVVADSDPGREYRESLKKAEALLRALDYCAGRQ